MSHLLEIVIKLGQSEIYFRLVLAVYLLTIALVFYSSLYFAFKLILIGGIVVLFRLDWMNKKPSNGIKEIHFIGNKWILVANNDSSQNYQEARVLIHNVLFQLIQFTNSEKKRHVVLFVDQISKNQLRQLHLKFI